MYAHLNALILADYLGADVVLPPSVYRESFAKYFSMDLTKNEVKWTPADTGALLDVAAEQSCTAAELADAKASRVRARSCVHACA